MKGAKTLHHALEQAGIEHTFLETEGAHHWHVWRRYLRDLCAIVVQVSRRRMGAITSGPNPVELGGRLLQRLELANERIHAAFALDMGLLTCSRYWLLCSGKPRSCHRRFQGQGQGSDAHGCASSLNVPKRADDPA